MLSAQLSDSLSDPLSDASDDLDLPVRLCLLDLIPRSILVSVISPHSSSDEFTRATVMDGRDSLEDDAVIDNINLIHWLITWP